MKKLLLIAGMVLVLSASSMAGDLIVGGTLDDPTEKRFKPDTDYEKLWPNMTYEERVEFAMREEGPKHQVCKDLITSSTTFGEYSYNCNRRNDLVKIEKEKKKREALIAKQPKAIRELINAKKVQLGMTKEQVILSWGKPEDISRTVGSWGVHEQWCYPNYVFLYFENGVLTSYQD